MYFKRGKRKIVADYGIEDIYRFYKENTENSVDYKTFSAAIKEFNKVRLYRLIYENETIRFPARIGGLMIRMKSSTPTVKNGKVDKSNTPVDWKRTLEYWKKEYPDIDPSKWKDIPNKKLFYHLNKHTEGRTAYFFWDKITSNVCNQSAYYLTISRIIKKELSYAIKTNKNLKYYE